MARTLTATIVPSAWNTWVTPSLRPMSPIDISLDPSAHAHPGSGQGGPEHRSERTTGCVSEERRGQRSHGPGSACASSHLDFDVDASRKAESHQGVDRLRRGVE